MQSKRSLSGIAIKTTRRSRPWESGKRTGRKQAFSSCYVTPAIQHSLGRCVAPGSLQVPTPHRPHPLVGLECLQVQKATAPDQGLQADEILWPHASVPVDQTPHVLPNASTVTSATRLRMHLSNTDNKFFVSLRRPTFVNRFHNSRNGNHSLCV